MPIKPSDLVDRYLHAVKFWLPVRQQKDILAELAEDLHAQMEEREAALGHPLAEEDAVEILKRRGAPLHVASSYLADRRLIDPAMLAVYWTVLKIVLLWVLLPIFAIVFLLPAIAGHHTGANLVLFWAEAWRTGFMVIGIVTVVFALLDRYRTKIKAFDNWDPRKLPRVAPPHETSARCNYFANAVFEAAGAFFWVYLMWQRTGFGLSDGTRIALAPIWGPVFWIVLAATVVDVCVDVFSFFRPAFPQVRARLRIALDVVEIVIAALLLQVSDWVTVTGPDIPYSQIGRISHWAGATVQWTLAGVIAVKLIDGLVEYRRLMRNKTASAAPILTMS